MHLLVAGPDDADASGTVHVDALVRVRRATVSHDIALVTVPVGTDDDDSIVPVLRAALAATVDPASMRSPLRSILHVLGPETASPVRGRRAFTVRRADESLVRPRAGDAEPIRTDDVRPTDALWRGRADDAVEWGDGRVLLYDGDVVQTLSYEESLVWLQATGCSLQDLAVRTGLPGSMVADLVGSLRGRGLLASEPWWRVRDDVAWVRRGEDLLFASRTGQHALPLAISGWGVVIWGFVNEHRSASVAQIMDHLRINHGVNEDVRSDVTGFLEGLRIAGLIGC